MSDARADQRELCVLTTGGLGEVLQQLVEDGFSLIGPRVRDAAIVYEAIDGIQDLPEGFSEVAEAGSYRLVRRGDRALFGFAASQESFKRSLFQPTVTLWRARRSDGSFVALESAKSSKLALIGVRSCDLHAIGIQDRTFLQGPYVDRRYAARRDGAFIVAINCSHAGGTCFCVSMQTGPRVTGGFDLALTELIDARGHRFLVEVGTDRGRALLTHIAHAAASQEDVDLGAAITEQTANSMGRKLETDGIKELLYQNLEHPRWDDVAGRCLACTNCTLVCPTCFCSTIEDTTSLDGETAERVQRWDSCFTLGHSYVRGGSVRSTIKSRYRQWLTHKVASWIDQFGTSGCVGCGRCITWCPVGIDITEEVAAIRASQGERDGVP